MCFGGGVGDGGAAEQRRQEELRQQRVREGRDKIDETFAQFDQLLYDAPSSVLYRLCNPAAGRSV